MISIFLFYNSSNGVLARMPINEDFKHVSIVTFDGDVPFYLTLNQFGLAVNRLKVRDLGRFLTKMRGQPTVTAYLACDCDVRVVRPWRPFFIQTCNEVCRVVSGLDIGVTLTPAHLFKKVLKWDGKRNFQILSAWRRKDNGMGLGVRHESILTGSDSSE